MDKRKQVQFEYRNHRGIHSTRTVEPYVIYFGATAWHPEPQWLLAAFDVDKDGERRDFAMKDICNWRPVP